MGYFDIISLVFLAAFLILCSTLFCLRVFIRKFRAMSHLSVQLKRAIQDETLAVFKIGHWMSLACILLGLVVMQLDMSDRLKVMAALLVAIAFMPVFSVIDTMITAFMIKLNWAQGMMQWCQTGSSGRL